MNVLSEFCIDFLNQLHKKFNNRRKELLDSRVYRTQALEWDLNTESIRVGNWKCDPIPDEVKDRKVEITGPPVPAKMIVNAVTSGANCYMADFEDSLSPTWENILEGQRNLVNYLRPNSRERWWVESKYQDKLREHKGSNSVLMVRPRGLHMIEANFFDMSASLFDFGVFIFNNAYALMGKNSRPYFYLAKLEHHLEAGWWADVFKFSENYLRIPESTIKCTVLVETLPAAFQMHEIVWELKKYITGLNAGRWDYLFSFIKNQPDCLLPDRDDVGMDQPFMEAYAHHIVDVCKKRGITPMGGMSAFVPKKGDEETVKKIIADKTLEHKQGFKGAWAAHPGYVDVIKDVFNTSKDWSWYHKNLDVVLSDLRHDKYYFGECHDDDKFVYKEVIGEITKEGLKKNIEVCMKYLVSWLQGNGCVAIDGKMEDAATAEISRMQIWQWLKHEKFTTLEVTSMLGDIAVDLATTQPLKIVNQAHVLLHNLIWPINLENKPDEFLTTSAYKEIIKNA